MQWFNTTDETKSKIAQVDVKFMPLTPKLI